MGQTEQEEIADRVQKRVDEILGGTPFYLVDLEVRGWEGSRAVDLFIDGDDGLGLDDAAELNREIKFVLDADEVFSGDYHLMVSSPGTDRPLTHPRQFAKHVGRLLEVKVEQESGGYTTYEGELVAADEDGITLSLKGTNDERELAHSVISWAKVMLPW